MNVIAENVARIREEMARAEARAGRPEGSVQLLAATKMNGADQVRAAIAAGVDACGENRVQELVEKNEQGAYTGAPLHFIGHLQKNKAKFLVGVADLIQSVDSPESGGKKGRCPGYPDRGEYRRGGGKKRHPAGAGGRNVG